MTTTTMVVESASKTQVTNVYCYPADVAEELRMSDCSSSQSSSASDSIADALQSAAAVTDQPCDSDDSVAMESFDDVEDFCIIDEPGLGIMVSSCYSLSSGWILVMQLCHVYTLEMCLQ